MITPFMAGEAGAQCVATQDCASLGYTEASCPNGGIKCPFGNTWSCKGEATAPKANCEVGWILYSDKTCSSTENRDITKTPIGVVFYKNPNGGGMALALKKLSGYKWLTENCSTLDECPSVYVNYGEFYNDFDSCGNTQKIVDFGDASRFPAAWAAHNYTTAGTKAGDWCLPSSGTLDLIMDNQNAILETLRNLNVYESYPFETFSSNLTVSSSSAGDLYIDPVCLSPSGSYYIISTCDNNIYTIGYVRPVIEF